MTNQQRRPARLFARLRMAFIRWKTHGDVGAYFIERDARRMEERRRPMTAWRRFKLRRYYRKHPEALMARQLRELDERVNARRR